MKVLEHFFQKLTINSRGFQKCSQKWSAMFNWFSFLVSKNDLKNGPVRLVKSLDLEHFFFVNLALNRCSLKFSQNVLQWNQHSKFFLIDFFMIYSWTVSISPQTFVSATVGSLCFASLRPPSPCIISDMFLLEALSQRCKLIRFGNILETWGFSKKFFE